MASFGLGVGGMMGFFRGWTFFPSASRRIPPSTGWCGRSGGFHGRHWRAWKVVEADDGTGNGGGMAEPGFEV